MNTPSLTIVVRDPVGSPRDVLIHATLKSIAETQISDTTHVYAPQLKDLDVFCSYCTDNVTVYASEPPKEVKGFLLMMEAGYFLMDDLLLRALAKNGVSMNAPADNYIGYGCVLRYPDGKMFSCRAAPALDPVDKDHLFCGPLTILGEPWGPQVGYQYTTKKLQYYFNMSGAGYGNIAHGHLGMQVKSLGILAGTSPGGLGFTLPAVMNEHDHTIVLLPGVRYEELLQNVPLLTHSRVEPVSAWGSWGEHGKGFYLGMDMVQAAFVGALRYGATNVVLYPPEQEEDLEPIHTCKKQLKHAIARMGYIVPSKDVTTVEQDEFCLWRHMRTLLEIPNHA